MYGTIMRIFIEFLNSIRVDKFIVVCCLISFIAALDSNEEKMIAHHYKDHGKISWMWEMELFCSSTIINKKFQRSLWSAYIVDVNIVLPLADCNVVQIETLTCVHRWYDERGNLMWNEESYVYSQTDEKIYTFDLKRNKEQCNGVPVDIMDYKMEISSGYELERIEILVGRGQPSGIGARNRKEAEEQIAILHRSLGKLSWRWDIKSFCESTIINEKFPGSLWSAYIADVNVVYPSADCLLGQIQTLTCVHRFTNERGIFVWNEESYVLYKQKEVEKIYTFDLKRNKEQCDGVPLNLIDYKEEISSSVDKFQLRTTHRDYGQPPFMDTRRLETDFKKQLVYLYEVYKTPIEWKWEMAPFCESRLHGTRSLGSTIKKRAVVLESADCSIFEMEVLNCEYENELKSAGYPETRQLYVNGLNHDIFTIGPLSEHSTCGKRYPKSYDNYEVLQSKIVGGERRPITTRSGKGI